MKIMKELICLIVTIVLLNNSYAQVNDPWSVGFNYTPFVLKPIFDNNAKGTGESLLNHKVGLDVYYFLNEKLELKSGIKYSYFEFRQELDVILPNSFCETVQTTSNTGEIYEVLYDDEYEVHFVGIPVELKYFFSDVHENLYTKMGFEILSLIKSELWLSEVFASHDCTPFHEMELNKFVYNLSFGIGYETPFTEKINFLIEPNIGITMNKMFKNPKNSDDQVTASINNNTRILDLGLLVGLKF